MMLFVANCAAVTVKKHWWGNEYYLASNEITEFRLNAQSTFVKIKVANQATVAVAATACGVGGPVAAVGGFLVLGLP